MVRFSIFSFVLITLVFLVWRFASERKSIPCPPWLGWLVELDNPFCKVQRASTIIENARIEPGMRVLDAGCGPGRVSIPALKQVGGSGHVVALDMQHQMLEKTRRKANDSSSISFLHAGLGEGKLEKEVFDRALLVTVLGEIPNQKAAVEELFSALKHGGVLSVTEIIFDPHFQRQKLVIDLATSCGFELESIFGRKLAYSIL